MNSSMSTRRINPRFFQRLPGWLLLFGGLGAVAYWIENAWQSWGAVHHLGRRPLPDYARLTAGTAPKRLVCMSTPALAPKGRGRRGGVEWWTGAAGIAAAVVLTIGWIVAGLLEPGYEWARQDISDLTAATAENPWVFRAAETVSGALLLVFALGLYGAVGDRWSGRVSAALLALFGAIQVAVGAYLHLDCSLAEPACRSAEHTTRHELHGALSGVSFLALLVAIFSLARRFHRDGTWRPLGTVSLIAGAATVAFLVLYMPLQWEQGGGIVQRLAITTVFGWIAVIGYRLASRPAAADARAPFT
jgi:hypothetical membrane protein